MEFTLEELINIYDTINLYMDTITVYDFESEKEYIEKTDKLNELMGKIWEIIK